MWNVYTDLCRITIFAVKVEYESQDVESSDLYGSHVEPGFLPRLHDLCVASHGNALSKKQAF